MKGSRLRNRNTIKNKKKRKEKKQPNNNQTIKTKPNYITGINRTILGMLKYRSFDLLDG